MQIKLCKGKEKHLKKFRGDNPGADAGFILTVAPIKIIANMRMRSEKIFKDEIIVRIFESSISAIKYFLQVPRTHQLQLMHTSKVNCHLGEFVNVNNRKFT